MRVFIVCSSTVAWSPRTPELTPLDFFFWDHMKQRVYFEPYIREQLWEQFVAVENEILENPNMSMCMVLSSVSLSEH